MVAVTIAPAVQTVTAGGAPAAQAVSPRAPAEIVEPAAFGRERYRAHFLATPIVHISKAPLVEPRSMARPHPPSAKPFGRDRYSADFNAQRIKRASILT